MDGSSFLAFLQRKSRRFIRLSLNFAGLVILLTMNWTCNSPVTEQVVQSEATTTAKPASQTVAPIESDTQADTSLTNSLLPDAQHIEGDPNAPLTIIEFSDFKCEFCADFATGPQNWLREYYIKTGKVRFAFKHVATLGPESIRAAEASECAAEQNQFWAYHDRIFADQVANVSELNDEMLIKLATDIGLETSTFSECLTSNRYANQIKLQAEEAERLGVQATPSFMINNSLLVGTQSYDTFARVINEELDKLGWEAPAGQESTDLANEIKGLIIYPPDAPPDDVLSGVWQNCGIYDEAVSIDNVLSSLAHGAVWIAYHADLPASQVEILRETAAQALAQRDEPMVILSPGPYTDRKIVVSAWQVQLTLEDASDPRLEQFLEKFQVGPFTPEPGEPCSGGTGKPLS